MGHFSIQQILCTGLLIAYGVGIVIDIKKKNYKNWNFLISVFISILIVTITFLISPVIVVGESMTPTLEDKDLLIINKISKDFEINDIVVFRSEKLNKTLIKRIVAKEGDSISMVDGELYVNKKLALETYKTIPTIESFDEIIIPKDSFFVMGDNRPGSLDSRSNKVGFIYKTYIVGEIILQED